MGLKSLGKAAGLDKRLYNVSRNRKTFLFVLFACLTIVWFLSGCIATTGPSVAGPETGNSPSSTANLTTIFEVYTGNFRAMAVSRYEMLLVRADGLVYYETGSRIRSQRTSKFQMRQGQITPEQVAKLKMLIENCPSDLDSKFGSNITSFRGPYAFLFSPTREIWEYEERNKRIAANFDPLTQNLTGFPDIPDEAKALWAELISAVKSTVPTDVHPQLWPDQYFDGRNYEVVPRPGANI